MKGFWLNGCRLIAVPMRCFVDHCLFIVSAYASTNYSSDTLRDSLDALLRRARRSVIVVVTGNINARVGIFSAYEVQQGGHPGLESTSTDNSERPLHKEAFGEISVYSHTSGIRRIDATYYVHKLLGHSLMNKRIKNRPANQVKCVLEIQEDKNYLIHVAGFNVRTLGQIGQQVSLAETLSMYVVSPKHAYKTSLRSCTISRLGRAQVFYISLFAYPVILTHWLGISAVWKLHSALRLKVPPWTGFQ
ncbi:hypothetical protein CSKR_103567 [Clonorchis sinensis]|uniref:Uncharacterized protein n=1 Tax=Clonorchis sinensis TaxID=79923 RepID=A0A3R7GG29_CLOSI|nr:hypothetical protein CSKR_103567 [Clonorchis sinensis]